MFKQSASEGARIFRRFSNESAARIQPSDSLCLLSIVFAPSPHLSVSGVVVLMFRAPSGVRGDMPDVVPREFNDGLAEVVVGVGLVRFSSDELPAATWRTDNIVQHAMRSSSSSAHERMAKRCVAIDEEVHVTVEGCCNRSGCVLRALIDRYLVAQCFKTRYAISCIICPIKESKNKEKLFTHDISDNIYYWSS